MDYKDNFKNIEVPMEADLVIKRAIKRAKNRHKKRFLKISSGIAAVLALSILLGKTSPAFAEYINNAAIPVKNLFSHFENKGIDNAVKNGFVQETSKNSKNSASDKGITVTIDQVAASGNEIIIGFTLKADEKYTNWKDLNIDRFKIIGDNGRLLYDRRPDEEIKKDAKKNNINPSIGELDGFNTKYIDEESFKNTKIKQGVFKFLSHNSKIDKIPNNITIEFYDFSDIVGGYFYNSSHGFFYKLTHKSPKFVKGTWSIPLKIDDKFKNAKEIKYVKAEETAKNSNIKIEYVNVYPTTANAKILLPYDMIITSMHLEDEKGNKYNQKGGTGYQTDTINASCPSFESLYFDKVGKLYLVFDAKENGKNKNFKIELKKQ